MGKTLNGNAGINLSPYAGDGYQLLDMGALPKIGIDYEDVGKGKSGEPRVTIDKSYDEVMADYDNVNKSNPDVWLAGLAGLGLLGGVGGSQTGGELSAPPPFTARLPVVNFAASNPEVEQYRHKNYAGYIKGSIV